MSETAVGILQGIEERQGGWHRFSISVEGLQYPLKLDTKQPDIIEAARGTFGELATWEYTEKEADKINPHTNKPYINRYLEGVELGATEEAKAAAATSSKISTAGGKEEMTKAEWDAKERRDYKSRSWAHTFSAYAHTIKVDEEPGAVFMRLKPMQSLIYHDIVGNFARDEEEESSDIPF